MLVVPAFIFNSQGFEPFLEHYLQDDFAANLTQNFSKEPGKRCSSAWNLEDDWLIINWLHGNLYHV